ncbi:MAG: hypothetical protein ACP5MW_04495 [Thermoplasmata archaeon]
MSEARSMTIYGTSFNMEKVRNNGVFSLEEFRDWVSEHGKNFLYSLSNLQNGDIIVFAWIDENKDWNFVGDAIVKQNHKIGSVDWCNCKTKEEAGYSSHILTGGVRLYPTAVKNRDIKDTEPIKLGQFVKFTFQHYDGLIMESVSHWKEKTEL